MPQVVEWIQNNWVVVAAIVLFLLQSNNANPFVERILQVLRQLTNTPEDSESPRQPVTTAEWISVILKISSMFKRKGNTKACEHCAELVKALGDDEA